MNAVRPSSVAPAISVLMPAYNEEGTIQNILERVLAHPFLQQPVSAERR